MAGKMTCMGVHAALTLTIIFVSATNNIAMANDNELVPADKSQLNKWFQANLAQKATLDPALAAAEANPKVITVKKDGSGDFKTLTDAINSIPAENTQRVIVNIGAGEYKEKITIPRNKPFVTLLGSPNNMPTVTFDGTAAKYGTVDSATLIAESDYFVGANLIIKNTSPKPDGKTKGAQALAIRVSGNKSALYNCKMHGFQDTLCDDKGLHVYKDCYIEGTVDFIFGSGKSLFLNTELNVISDPGLTVIAAHARDSASEDTGYSFVHCRVTGTGTDAFLGRAWRASPQVVYSYTNMDKNVNPAGWNNGNKPEHEKTVFFGEYQSMGPGASVAGRAKYSKQLTNAEAKPFLSLGYVQASKWLLPPPTSKL